MFLEKPVGKRLRKISKLNSRIEAKLMKQNAEVENEENEVVNAYVTFKSMEGRERAIKAYLDESWLRWVRGKCGCRKQDYTAKM